MKTKSHSISGAFVFMLLGVFRDGVRPQRGARAG